MNWLTNYVKPKLKSVMNRKETPDNLWYKCKSCGQMIFEREFEDSLSVCAHCDHHERIGPDARFNMLFDRQTFQLIDMPKVNADPLKFKDSKRYVDRLKQARSKTGDEDALQAAVGKIESQEAVVVVQNFFFMGGSMGMAVGDGFITAVKHAIKINAPLIIYTAAGGARMQEGILSLMQMPRTTVAIQMLKEASLPYLVVLTDPTTGGVTASYAMLGDIQIAEPGALIGFAGPRVIEQNLREKLPEGFQRAEYLLDHGMVDMIVHRKDQKKTLGRILGLLKSGEPRAATN